MQSISLSEVLRQAQRLVPDPEDRVYGDLDGVIADGIKCLLEGIAASEVEQRLGVRLYERGVSTPIRHVTIRIPRMREQGYVPSFLSPRHRAIEEVEDYVASALLAGIGRAQIIRYMEDSTGARPSDGVIRRVQEHIDLLAKEFKERKLTEKYAYLFLDAAWAKDIVGVNAAKICILTAVGITEDGEKEILGFERSPRESEAAWRGFLSRLVARGLDPTHLKLVISDEHMGIGPAVGEVLGDVPHQLCWAHRVRNILKAVDKQDRKEMVKGLRGMYRAEHKTAAKQAYRDWEERWKDKYPSLVANLREDLGKLLTFFQCTTRHWKYIRTTNPIERCFLELRRRRYGCGAFADPRSCDRVVFGVFHWLNELWEDKSIWMKPAYRDA